MTTPTVAEVVARIRELVHAITQGRESLLREFTMRVPAEPKRDADLVLSAAAHLLEREHKARSEAEQLASECRNATFRAMERATKAERELAESERKLNIANGTIANIMDAKCQYVVTSHEGTSYCTLAESTGKELAELRKRVAEAPRGMVRGFMLEPETQPGWLDKMGGKHVAIVPLREGE